MSAHHVAMQVLLAQVCSCHVIRVAAVEKAEAEKIAVVKAAEGDAESKYLQGQVSIPDLFFAFVSNLPCTDHRCSCEVFAPCEFGTLCQAMRVVLYCTLCNCPIQDAV